MPLRALGIHKRIGVAEAFAVERNAAEQRVVHGLFVQVGILRIVIGKVELVSPVTTCWRLKRAEAKAPRPRLASM